MRKIAGKTGKKTGKTSYEEMKDISGIRSHRAFSFVRDDVTLKASPKIQLSPNQLLLSLLHQQPSK